MQVKSVEHVLSVSLQLSFKAVVNTALGLLTELYRASGSQTGWSRTQTTQRRKQIGNLLDHIDDLVDRREAWETMEKMFKGLLSLPEMRNTRTGPQNLEVYDGEIIFEIGSLVKITPDLANDMWQIVLPYIEVMEAKTRQEEEEMRARDAASKKALLEKTKAQDIKNAKLLLTNNGYTVQKKHTLICVAKDSKVAKS